MNLVLEGGMGLMGLKLLCLILLSTIILGAVLGASLELETISMLPSLKAASSRAIIIAKTIFQAIRHLGLDDAQTLTLSPGIGIFANNALTTILILFSPIPILLAKPFSDKHLSKLHYEHGIRLFKPIGCYR
ncbi:MAG: hypothetical protein L2C94_001750 [Aigarchaeota archaeon]|nr:hypothetical protein [Candidatus Wolframiiraptor gerlachensis]